MSDTPQEPALPPSLRFLKWLVIVLMITMIAGVITVVGLLVTRMPEPQATNQSPEPQATNQSPEPQATNRIPDNLALPAGAVPEAVTFGKGWIAVVTEDARILIFTPDGRLVQEIAVTTAAAPD